MRSAGESLRLAEEVGATVRIAAATVVQAKLAAMRGNLDACEAYALQVERLVLSPNTNFLLALLQNARGIAALGAGRSLEAYEHLQRLHAPADPAFNTNIQFFSLADYVEAAVSCGQEAVAAAAIDDVERRSAPMAVPWVQIMLSYSKALLAPPARAETFFQDGLALSRRTGRSCGGDCSWPMANGCGVSAASWKRAPLRTARDILDALGAVPWGNRARRELRAAGEASRPQAGRVLDALTPQELQIAELAADGFSNKEIGARLYLSHRTVGYHLYRIFPKLGITARSGLRTALNRPQPIV
jgi:ATP/maltotriose-dependent transcriptional regulator MalT